MIAAVKIIWTRTLPPKPTHSVPVESSTSMVLHNDRNFNFRFKISHRNKWTPKPARSSSPPRNTTIHMHTSPTSSPYSLPYSYHWSNCIHACFTIVSLTRTEQSKVPKTTRHVPTSIVAIVSLFVAISYREAIFFTVNISDSHFPPNNQKAPRLYHYLWHLHNVAPNHHSIGQIDIAS